MRSNASISRNGFFDQQLESGYVSDEYDDYREKALDEDFSTHLDLKEIEDDPTRLWKAPDKVFPH